MVEILNILAFQALQPFNRHLVDSCHKLTIAQPPSSICATLSKFDINMKTGVYAVCPKCHHSCAPQTPLGDSTAKYPSHCTNHPTPGLGDCSQPLLRCNTSNQKSSRPIKPFVYHDYLAGLLSIKYLEEVMDKPCDQLRDVVKWSLLSVVSDVQGVELLRLFKAQLQAL